MSNHIEQKPVVQPQSAPQNPETPVEPIVPEHEYAGHAGGNENGGIYFELSWDTGQAQYRQHQLLTVYMGNGGAGENSGYNPEINPRGNSQDSGYFGFDGNFNPSESNEYGGYQYSSDGDHYGYDGNSTFSDYYASQSNENGSLFSIENLPLLSWSDLIDIVTDHPDFNDFKDHSNEFWREMRQFSETSLFQNDNDDTQTENFSTYEKLLDKFNSKEIPLEKFIENLPPKEKELFTARYQIDQTFGDNIFEADGVTLNENGNFRALAAAIESGQFQNLPESVQSSLPENFAFVSKNGEIAYIKNENGELISTRREAATDAENAILFGENMPANRLVSDKTESLELKQQDKSGQVAVGNNAGSILTDNGASRLQNHAASLDNSSSVSSVARRDGGVVLGGALISGSFASIENFKNAENKGVGNSGSVSNADASGGKSFAAGATGAMMSAAIGSLVPSSDAVISGVVGFISGVVIGVEADQGLRWLSGDRPTAIASPAQVNLLEENSFAQTLQPLLA